MKGSLFALFVANLFDKDLQGQNTWLTFSSILVLFLLISRFLFDSIFVSASINA